MTVPEAKSPHSAEYPGHRTGFLVERGFCQPDRSAPSLEAGTVRSGRGMRTWSLGPQAVAASAERRPSYGHRSKPVWIKGAKRIASRAGLGRRTHFQVGSADGLPSIRRFLVRSRHLPDPADPRRRPDAGDFEMLRVTRVGGGFCWWNQTIWPLLSFMAVRILPFRGLTGLTRKTQAICETGKASVGEGNDSFGDLVPGKLSAASETT